MNIETIEKVRVLVRLKTDGGIYPRGAVLFAPFPEDLIADIVAGNTIEVLWDSAIGIDGTPIPEDKPSKTVAVDPDLDEKQQLEAYLGLLDPNVAPDKRKGVKTLRKDVTKLVLKKAQELGKTLDSKAEVAILMKEFLDLQAAVEALDEADI